jgi:hypothetical protein
MQCIDDHLSGRRFDLDALTHIETSDIAHSV